MLPNPSESSHLQDVQKNLILKASSGFLEETDALIFKISKGSGIEGLLFYLLKSGTYKIVEFIIIYL